MREVKRIPLRTVKAGDTFNNLIIDNVGSIFSHYEVIKNEGAFVVLKQYDQKKIILTENAFIEVPLTVQEFKNKYEQDKQKLVQAMKNKILLDDCGSHEMYNAWIDPDPYQMAANCKAEKLTVIGVCDLGEFYKVAMFSDDILDIGVVAEYEDGTRIWCHAKSEWFSDEDWR